MYISISCLIIFLISLLLLAYTLVGYPFFILVRARLFPNPVRWDTTLRPLSVILCVNNEEAYIRERLDNLLKMDYPQNMFEIIVVSDGSIDNTDNIVRSFSDRQVKLVRLRIPKGKAAALNEGILHATNDILLLCDARQQFEPDVAQRLVSHFADNSVGAVSGRLVIRPFGETGAAAGINSYWNYEVRLRENEAISDSVIGATGAIYAIRKSLFQALPDGTILDDVLIPMQIVLKGKRVLYDINAIASDEKPVHDKGELTRKVRTLFGNLQLYRIAPELFSPATNRLWFRFISHKILRLMLPYLLIICLFSSLFAGGQLALLGLTQLVCWIAAVLAWYAGAKSLPWRALSGFLLLNIAVIIAWYKFITGRSDVWVVPTSHDSQKSRGGAKL
jgi:cellulose synthase/poly-beta-1,6-N-acetylglucosamine synthase-like glycosyltransferase